MNESRTRNDELTEIEHFCLRAMAEGKRPGELAVAPHNAYHRIKEACRKLGARTTAQAVHIATKKGLI